MNMFGLGMGLGFSGGGTQPRKNEAGEDILFEPAENSLLLKMSLWVPDITKEIFAYLSKHPEKMRTLPPRKFEELIATIFKNQGFDVTLTPETRDGGFDVIAVNKHELTGESIYLVECKRYAADNKVGVGVVRSLLGVVVHQKATKGIIATTSFFSREARQIEEKNRSLLSLSDYDMVVKWLDEKMLL